MVRRTERGERPDRFCLALTLATAGAAYVVAVWCVYRLGLALGLPLARSLALAASFGLATVALTYSRHVNAHIILLAVAAALFLGLVRLANVEPSSTAFWLRVAWLGSLAGVGYTCDLGGGPLLVICARAFDRLRLRNLGLVALFALFSLPWLALHHGINYSIGGSFRPINSVPEYSVWPGSPFNAENLTGAWNHSFSHFAMYAAAMLVGKRGFFGHNLPLFLAVPGMILLVRRRTTGLPEAMFGCAWAIGMWLLYAALSNNYAGVCCSVRWFVPLLVPGYYVLALLLREYPEYRWDFWVLSAWGAVMAVLMLVARAMDETHGSLLLAAASGRAGKLAGLPAMAAHAPRRGSCAVIHETPAVGPCGLRRRHHESREDAPARSLAWRPRLFSADAGPENAWPAAAGTGLLTAPHPVRETCRTGLHRPGAAP